MKLQGRHIVLALACILLAVDSLYLYRHHRLLSDESPTLQGDPNHPSSTSNWVDTRLYFGIGTTDAPDKSRDAEWQAFLDTEVTPRFPAGLSVLDVYGQWQRHPGSAPIRVRTKLLVIDYPETPDNEARIEAIRLAWKRRTGDQSVLKVTQPANVSF
jgi:hypothetical protein